MRRRNDPNSKGDSVNRKAISKKRLILASETIRRLAKSELSYVRGGGSEPPTSNEPACTDGVCNEIFCL